MPDHIKFWGEGQHIYQRARVIRMKRMRTWGDEGNYIQEKSKLTPLVSKIYGPESGLYGLLKDGETKM